MKKLFTPLMCYFIAIAAIINFSCSSTKVGKYVLTEQDAALAVRQLLEIGAKDGAVFTKEGMMDALFPEQVKKTLNTLQQLGLTSEIDRFTTTPAMRVSRSRFNLLPARVWAGLMILFHCSINLYSSRASFTAGLMASRS